MKKKGFTLIELLAVIVILAIIALIATPLVLKYIQSSKDEARLRSAENYLNAVEKAVVNQNMQGKKFSPNVCTVKDEKLYCDGILLDVSIKGVKPDDGSVITFNNGKIDRVKLLYEDKIIVDNEKDILVYSEDVEILPAGLYDDNNSLLASWDELVNTYGLKLDTDYTNLNFRTSGSMYAVLNNNSNLSSATKIIIGDDVSKIGNYAFTFSSNLKSVVLNDKVASIGQNAFNGCKNLEKMIIPDSVVNLGAAAFSTCDKLSEVTLPSNLTIIPNRAFYHCESLKKINIPKTVSVIDTYAFQGSGLTEIDIPESVTTIKTWAFNKTQIENLFIPKTVTSIGDYAFSAMNNLKIVKVDSQNTVYDSRNNSNVIIETATNKLIAGFSTSVIPDTVTAIGKGAFVNSNIEKIVIPNGVVSLGGDAFNGSKLKEVKLPKTLTMLDPTSFAMCNDLETIIVDKDNPEFNSGEYSDLLIETATNAIIKGTKNAVIPENITVLFDASYSGIVDLEEITIPKNVKSIGTSVFSGCSNLRIINYEGSEAEWNSISFGRNWNYGVPTDLVVNYNYTGN